MPCPACPHPTAPSASARQTGRQGISRQVQPINCSQSDLPETDGSREGLPAGNRHYRRGRSIARRPPGERWWKTKWWPVQNAPPYLSPPQSSNFPLPSKEPLPDVQFYTSQPRVKINMLQKGRLLNYSDRLYVHFFHTFSTRMGKLFMGHKLEQRVERRICSRQTTLLTHRQCFGAR